MTNSLHKNKKKTYHKTSLSFGLDRFKKLCQVIFINIIMMKKIISESLKNTLLYCSYLLRIVKWNYFKIRI